MNPAERRKRMDAGQIQKLVEVDLGQLAARATNPRATLGALGQKIVAGMESVEQQMADLDARALEIPSELDASGETLKKLQAVIAKAENDARPDLAAAAEARIAKEKATIATLQREGDSIDVENAALEDLLQQLQIKQVDIDGAIAAAPPDVEGVVNPPHNFDIPFAKAASVLGAKLGTSPGAASPSRAAAPGGKLGVASAPRPSAAAPTPTAPVKAAPAPAAPAKVAPSPTAPVKAAPAAPAAAKKGGDALDDEFAALFASENLSLDEIQLPKKSLKKAVALPESDYGIPDLVMVSEGELPDDATAEDRAPMPTAPAKGVKPAAGAPARPTAPAPSAKAAPAAGSKASASAPAKASAPAGAPKKGRALFWVGTVTVVGGGTVAVLHFVFNVFGLIPV